ncbi:copper chaperone PCu(A)C [Thiomicrorhabdus sp.]|uniref:copper chaperone PCu(A)C n=1 Tax=Thiomicrorhabdus sp. TaxID=2039724 RepID=UPI00356AB0F1
MSLPSSFKTKLVAIAFGTMASFSSFSVFADQAEQIEISNAYAREVPPGAPASASFMTLTNNSDQDIKLVEAQSGAAEVVELHTHSNDNGVMRMRKIENINIPAHGQAVLQPGGLHIMLIEPVEPLQQGQTVKLKLKFEDGSQKAVSMPVKSLKTMSMPMNHNHGDMH